jgi:aspartokinase
LSSVLSENGIGLRFFSLGKGRLSFLIEEVDYDKTKEMLQPLDSALEEMAGVSIVSLVGEGISHTKEVLPRCLKRVEKNRSNCLLLSMNSLSLTLAVPTSQKNKLAQELHEEFIEVGP